MDKVYLDVQGAFRRALASGLLSDRRGAYNFVEYYRYEYTINGVDIFRNTRTGFLI